MKNVVVVGSQWGDEGKGKIVDWLSEQADIVIRFQGGHNAGHTLVIDGVTYKLRLLPSGIVRKDKISIIGFSLIIGGGIGNIFDRIVYGSVTDFLYLDFGGIFKTGIFNIADLSVTTGMILILISSFKKNS